jgi:hypothetical protein
MNVYTFPTAAGPISFTETQIAAFKRATGQGPKELPPPQDGIPDFTDEQIVMMIEDEGNIARALAARRYH